MVSDGQRNAVLPVLARLRIRYRSGDGEVTEREISDCIIQPPNQIYALCHLRGERRSFVLSRIEEAVELKSGEVIPDIWEFFSLPSLKLPPTSIPAFSRRPTPMTLEQGQRQRGDDKRALFERFKYPAIEESVRRRLGEIFNNRCFRCGIYAVLEMDHHVPQYLGGRLVPGNIVLLCARCNSQKGDKPPEVFYTPQQLARLEEIFSRELALFDFSFNWTRWTHDREEYLRSIGLSMLEIWRMSHPLRR